MGNSVFTRIGINRAICLPHPFWNSLGKKRQAVKAATYLEKRPGMIDHLATDQIIEHTYLLAAYTKHYSNLLRLRKLSLSDFLLKFNEFCRCDKAIGPVLIELGQSDAVKLAKNIQPKVVETKIGAWQELSRIKGEIRERTDIISGNPLQDIPPYEETYRYQAVTITVKGNLKIETTFKQERRVLESLINIFPASADLFRAILQAIPQDQEVILKEQIRQEYEEIRLP